MPNLNAGSYKELNSNATSQLKVGKGVLVGIVVTVPGGGSIRVRDDDGVAASGPYIIGGAGAVALPAAGSFLNLNAIFQNGCTVVVSGMTAGSVTAVFQ